MPFPSFSLKFNQDNSYSSLPSENLSGSSSSLIIDQEKDESDASTSGVSGTELDHKGVLAKTASESALQKLKPGNPTSNTASRKAPQSKSLPIKPQEAVDEVLYSNKASLNVGQVYRYKITYTPPEISADSPTFDSSLWLKVKNLEVVALRAAYLAGPFILYVDVRPEDYDQNSKIYSTADQPMYEPQLKAGQSFYAQLFMNKNKKQYTWIVDVMSQIIFSNTAQVQFEISVGTSREALYNSSSSNKHGTGDPGIIVTKLDTLDLWHSPTPKFDKPLHLVVVTHGLHSNTGADMLYVKEAIDAAATKSGENIVVRGYFGNVRKTEKGIKYLGKRLAEYIVHELAPKDPSNLPPVKKISFIGHSLGGLVQTYAIAYIASHYPDFFQRIDPVNFICLASPLLGISNENPSYIKFALDIGFVGKSGQDIGLTRKPDFTGKSSKPLLQILPTGPTHEILVRFKHRTLYANAVNDGIVPLRTSALLYLDWQGLGKVEQAKRGEDTGKSPTFVTDEGPRSKTDTHAHHHNTHNHEENNSNDEEEEDMNESHDLIGKIPEANDSSLTPRELNNTSTPQEEGKGMFSSFAKNGGELFSTSVSQPVQTMLSYFVPHAGTTKPPKMFTRGQTLAPSPDDVTIEEDDEKTRELSTDNDSEQKHGKSPEHFKTSSRNRTNSLNSKQMVVPKKTSVFESGVSVLLPPLPSQSFILDPDSRPPAIFHDRIYHDYDLPAPRLRKRTSLFNKNEQVVDKSKMEEKMARDWHRGLSWRKVLVRLEPDAHNNIIVRRRFANAYGWPVIDHLVQNHFAGEPPSSKATTPQDIGTHTKLRGFGVKHLTYTPLDVMRDLVGKKISEDQFGKEISTALSSDTITPNTVSRDSKNHEPGTEINDKTSEQHPQSLPEKLTTKPDNHRTYSEPMESPTSVHSWESSSSSSVNNTNAWEMHLDMNRDDSEDEGILFTMGNMFDNIREIGNFNFNALSSLNGNSNDKSYANLPTAASENGNGHSTTFEDDNDRIVGYSTSVGKASYSERHRRSKSSTLENDDTQKLEDEYSMYGPLNGETIEERLAKQGF